MSQTQNNKRYDLEDRTLQFGINIIRFIKLLSQNGVNFKLIDQLIRSATSIGANYREANETETKRDFLYRCRICRKETKETIYWLELIKEANPDLSKQIDVLMQEATEFVKIFASIIEKSR